MNEKMFAVFQLYCTGMIFILIWGLLLWTNHHGGVPSHHILADKDLPKISNWWGGLLLPLLTFFLLYRMKKRVMISNKKQESQKANIPVYLMYAFLTALIYGILLSVFFTLGYPDIPGYMFIGIFVLSLFFPIYRAEYVLGFVIGMTFTFGVVLPTLVVAILALIGVILYLCIRPLILYVVSRFLFFRVSNRQKSDK